jgi:hypothetical protein
MPLYDTSSNPQLQILPGDVQILQNAETVSVNGTAVIQRNVPNSIYQPAKALNISIEFSGNPGAFELDIQDSDEDEDSSYQSIPNALLNVASIGSDGSYNTRYELSPFTGNWIRPYWKTAPANAVTVTVRLAR